ncbi:MAG: oligosaccharide flippase family protein [Chloroflexota bacterium]
MSAPDRSAAAVSRRIFAVFVVRIGAAIIGVVNAFVLARLLGPSGKGDFYLVQLVPSTLLVLGQIGLPSAISYYAGRGQMRGLARRSLILALGLSLAGMVITIASLPLLMSTLFREVSQDLVLVALAIVPFVYMFTFGNAILTGRQRVAIYGAVALGQVILALLLFLVLIGALGLGVGGAILAYLGYSMAAGIAVTVASLLTPVDRDAGVAPWRSIFHYGLRLYPASLSGFFSYRADVYLLALLGTSSEQLGFYSIAVASPSCCSSCPISVVTVFFPHVAGGTREEADNQAGVVTRVTIAATGSPRCRWPSPR